ncbi:arylsulfatase regulator [Algibacter lectus]|uniref:Arylsulfatase regulator n=2 Tax=Algibacter lectus TaxID=221126 RepID=A0A090WPG6_9FLAO|nr:arylsulfatase regulator [Algibacter lectus]
MLIKETDINDELFSLMVLPTMNCNFKCWYCYESHIKGSKMQEPALNKIKLLLNNKFNTMQNMKNFHLSYFGGEPLLYFDDVVLPTLRHTYNLSKQHNISLFTHFTTNGFLINDYVMENLVKYEVNSFQITFDGNKENHNKVRYVSKTRGSYDGIVSNIKRLVRSNIKVSLRINYTNDNIDGLYDILDSFQDLSMDNRKKITLHMQRVWQEKKTEGLFQKSRQVSDKFNEFGFQLPNPKALNTLRQSCYADKKYQAAINYNGDVFKCNARDFKKENREGILNDKGEIEWNAQFYDRMSIKLKNKPCQECSIMPICGGGACSQYALERKNEDFCIHDFDEKSKKNVILEMFLNGDHTRV